MSINLSIKNVPDELARLLRGRAEANHRSLQGELMALLESALAARTAEQARRPYEAGVVDTDHAPPPTVLPTSLPTASPISLRDIYELARAQPTRGGPSSLTLLHEARAERDEQLNRLVDAPDAYARARAMLAGVASARPAPSTSAKPKAAPRAKRLVTPRSVTPGKAATVAEATRARRRHG